MFLKFQGLAWCYSAIIGVTDDDNCPESGVDVGAVYIGIWFVVTALLWVICTFFYFYFDLLNTYGFETYTFLEQEVHSHDDTSQSDTHSVEKV